MPRLDQAILIVEDDEPTRELYLRELSRHYRVFTTSCVDGALDLLHSQQIAAVVLEPATPGGHGWQLLTSLTRIQDAPPIPIILCSILDERKRGLELGACTYLVKPVLPKTLLEAVRRAIGLARVTP